MPLTRYWCELAWIDGTARHGTLITADPGTGRITEVTTADTPPPGAEPLRGLTVPGLANAHSHAFHRALRGPAQLGTGTFWTWRETMYAIAAKLDPDSMFALARGVYAEMALAGIGCVGEFHYLHHRPGGRPYANPNAMGEALMAAAHDAGLRITLLDTAYLAGGFDLPPEPHQARFSDGTAHAWAERADALKPTGPHARIGAAIHSVRAVPTREMPTVAQWAADHGAPLHVHLSEQTAENDACADAHATTPTRLLADRGVLGPHTTAVHATHLTGDDIRLLGGSRTGVCFCPTTERDLADGIGPAPQLRDAGSPLSLGSDSHAVIDLLEEARALELNERLRSRTRGHFTAAQLLRAASEEGHGALGWPEAGRIEKGSYADLTTLDLTSVRTAGAAPEHAAQTAVFAASAADVRHTVVGARHIVRDGRHRLVDDPARALAEAIAALR